MLRTTAIAALTLSLLSAAAFAGGYRGASTHGVARDRPADGVHAPSGEVRQQPETRWEARRTRGHRGEPRAVFVRVAAE